MHDASEQARLSWLRENHPDYYEAVEAPPRDTGEWMLLLICCGRHDGYQVCLTPALAEEYRESYVGRYARPEGHDRQAVLSKLSVPAAVGYHNPTDPDLALHAHVVPPEVAPTIRGTFLTSGSKASPLNEVIAALRDLVDDYHLGALPSPAKEGAASAALERWDQEHPADVQTATSAADWFGFGDEP